jgi:hypothetical protein
MGRAWVRQPGWQRSRPDQGQAPLGHGQLVPIRWPVQESRYLSLLNCWPSLLTPVPAGRTARELTGLAGRPGELASFGTATPAMIVTTTAAAAANGTNALNRPLRRFWARTSEMLHAALVNPAWSRSPDDGQFSSPLDSHQPACPGGLTSCGAVTTTQGPAPQTITADPDQRTGSEIRRHELPSAAVGD